MNSVCITGVAQQTHSFKRQLPTAGLPQEDEIMLGEVTDLLQRLQPFLAQMLPRGAPLQPEAERSVRAVTQHREAAAAVLWAMCCVEQCSRPNPAGRGVVLADGIDALPQVCSWVATLQIKVL